MTGFADAAGESPRRRIEITIQGWNHRHLDCSVRLPEELASREAAVRERVASVVARGRCSVTVRVTTLGERGVRLAIDREALARLAKVARELEVAGLIEAKVTLGDLLRTPQLLVDEAGTQPWDAADDAVLEEVLARSLTSFDHARAGEGGRLEQAIRRGRHALGDLVARLEARREATAGQLAAAIQARLDLILPGGTQPLPPERLAQEIALLADRSDVREEIDRLEAHLAHFDEACAGEGAIGKRLDFLAQEVLRELNTLGAKCRDVESTRLVVDAKVICEQVREQLQNVE